jgi:hypothetical protein
VTVENRDEGPHAPGGQPEWSETWGFTFRSDDGIAGDVRLTYAPAAGRAEWWTRLDVADEGLVVVRDDTLPMPRHAESLRVRGDGLWAELVCETAFEHWGIVLEAFGLRVDDPADERGERLPVGLDLEWEVEEGAPPEERANGYAQRGRVHGDVLVATRRIPFDGPGTRDHTWGAWHLGA